MADITIPVYMDSTIVTDQVKGTMMVLTGAVSGEGIPIAKPAANSTTPMIGVLKEDWTVNTTDPAGSAVLAVSLAGTATLKRELAIISVDNPLVPVEMGGSATTVVPGDYIIALAGGLGDKWVTGSSHLKQGRVVTLGPLKGVASDLLWIVPTENLGAIA